MVPPPERPGFESGPAALAEAIARLREEDAVSLPLLGEDTLGELIAETAGFPFPGRFLAPFDGTGGSNSWVVSPRRSTTGHAILANDPHLGFSLPSVWYQVHLLEQLQVENGEQGGSRFAGVHHIIPAAHRLQGLSRRVAVGKRRIEGLQEQGDNLTGRHQKRISVEALHVSDRDFAL